VDSFGVHAAEIRLDTIPAVLGVAVLTTVLVGLVPWRWDAWRHRRAGRTITVLAAVLAVVVSSGLVANRLGSFYPTLGALLGTSADPGEGTLAEAGPNGTDLVSVLPKVRDQAAAGKGSTIHLTVTGARTHLTRDVDVYLPAAYSDPRMANVRFPVVEWFPGFPGEPREVVSFFGLPARLDAAISADRMPPAVVIIPDINGEPRMSHDEECVDAVGGTPDDTFLSADIHTWALHALRVRQGRTSWALAGWSSGGYCALNLALRHPQWYGTAASQSGYDAAPEDVVTGDLFHGRGDIRAANDVSVLLRTHPVPMNVLVTAGRDEREEQAALARIRAAATAPVQVDSAEFPGGGHNADAVRAQLPEVIGWLGAQLPPPVVPEEHPPGGMVAGPGIRPWPLPDPGTRGALVGTQA
jgi:enterochelin esterase-like enzyme